VLSSEVQRRVAAELAKLSVTERAAFTLRHFEGRSIEEIGQVLHLRQSATKNSIFRAVQKLRRALQPWVAAKGSAG
jgi:RNA polymerase sigma-70 factor (ECF subfamily)